MAIKNNRKSINEASAENRLKARLKESYKRFLTEDEAGEDELGLGDEEDMDLGADTGEDMENDMGLEDMPAEQGEAGDFESLTDEQAEQVDSWVDDLLNANLESDDVMGTDSLDTEIPADSLDPMGEEQTVDGLPITVDELNNVISSDDSLHALEDTLVGLAGEEEGIEGLDDMNGMEDETDELETLGEAKDPFEGIKDLPGYEQGFEGEDVKDELMEEVSLQGELSDLGFEETKEGLNDKITSTVTPTPGARTKEDLEKDAAGVVQESIKKSKMLVKAAAVIAQQKKALDENKKQVEALKLENYKLLKANGILSVAGDKLNKEARTKIAEAFDQCKTKDQVDSFYGKLVENVKKAARPSLNEAVVGKKINISKIESEKQDLNESVTNEQMRKNMLMGLNTADDMYFKG